MVGFPLRMSANGSTRVNPGNTGASIEGPIINGKAIKARCSSRYYKYVLTIEIKQKQKVIVDGVCREISNCPPRILCGQTFVD